LKAHIACRILKIRVFTHIGHSPGEYDSMSEIRKEPGTIGDVLGFRREVTQLSLVKYVFNGRKAATTIG
jgi:hypothetical protein